MGLISLLSFSTILHSIDISPYTKYLLPERSSHDKYPFMLKSSSRNRYLDLIDTFDNNLAPKIDFVDLM